MDITEISLATLTALGPYLAKGAFTGVGKDLWELLKKTFVTEREKKLLDEVEKSPADLISQGKVAGKLEEKLEADATLLDQLKTILEKLPVDQKANKQTIIGNNNIGLQDTNNSKIKINSSEKK